MSDYYTPAQVATITEASKPAIRNYTQLYARYFSTESTPEKGKSRIFTAADVKLIAFIREKTVDQNQSHDDTRKALDSGELEHFVWSLPHETQQEDETEPNAQYQLVPVERLQAAMSLLEDARTRETQARQQLIERERELQERLTQREQKLQSKLDAMTMELGKAQGELSAYKSIRKRPKWWLFLFGGE